MFSLLGANGAGKTTLFRALTGILVGRSGEIVFRGTNITALRSHEIVRLGIAHIAEGKHLFGPLSVAKNLELGALAVHAGRHDEVARARWSTSFFPDCETGSSSLPGRFREESSR